ncbi:class A beta-lactamase [Pseudomonas petrae]|uniref:Beta-lactamase n=1 Tax=Pseudomonas petrae TaxID=2912190 RepID=A0ABS9IBY6_9PSED|nr:class A beta-lactamase [Pseudomonas petrae]MCF7535022.1 class A beta-lactamase [Pseudomonas petrae]MCF7538141.1 class A beta-lactamase [Pseudomonas petrae]MCF7544937.1 class A beta-lactamase [Pseudomonas petrae]MCF7555504.1 class A beta-lactamase [Pseudomonas petrae]
MITRRTLLGASLLAVPTLLSLSSLAAERRSGPSSDRAIEQQLADLERRHGGRLGVAILDTASQRLISHRGDERFALCSTFKCLAAAYVLARVDQKQEDLSRRIVYSAEQLVPYSPTTELHVGGQGLSVGSLCEAAMTLSDNTAANLLLDSMGGPEGLTTWLRSIGDTQTRLDRREPDLNENRPEDLRDTTTPVAMLQTLNTLVLGDELRLPSRDQLTAWLVNNRTGDKKLRAGVPGSWRVGDKTGSGANNASNDVAVIWPGDRPPILVTAYYTGSKASGDQINALMADIGRLAATV